MADDRVSLGKGQADLTDQSRLPADGAVRATRIHRRATAWPKEGA